jgi:pimeloyl-ACP methyl ester carboxylesterase
MKKISFLFALLPLLTNAQSFEGDWYSSFNVMGQSAQVQLNVTENPKVNIELIFPKQEASYDCDESNITDTEISFKWNLGGIQFKGALEEGEINGEFTQNGFSWEATFTREEQEEIVINRWQVPKAPFNYSSDSVQIQNGDISLGGTLVLPENFDSSTPIVILVSGSGPQNRDCEIAGHKSFWVIADHLARNNIASLRFDDRGTGTSEGNTMGSSLMELGSDAEAFARYLRKERKFKKNPLGMAGHSEGGMHTLIAATNYKKIDFLIQLATVGTDGMSVLIQQQYDIPKASGDSDDLCQWNRKLYAEMSEMVLALPQREATDSLTKFLGDTYDNPIPSFDKAKSSRLQFIMSNITFMNNQWMREFLAFETQEYLDQIDLPLLAIHMEKDIQVEPNANSKGFENYANAQRHIVPGLNHLMQPCERCSIDEYGEIETTISPDVLTLLTDWILALD